MKLSVKHMSNDAQPEGYQEPHNVDPKAHLVLDHRWDLK